MRRNPGSVLADAVSQLRHTRSLRCTYTATAMKIRVSAASPQHGNRAAYLTTIFARYTEGTADFVALDSRHSAVAIVSGSMSSGSRKALT
jgi:hypothetical protein